MITLDYRSTLYLNVRYTQYIPKYVYCIVIYIHIQCCTYVPISDCKKDRCIFWSHTMISNHIPWCMYDNLYHECKICVVCIYLYEYKVLTYIYLYVCVIVLRPTVCSSTQERKQFEDWGHVPLSLFKGKYSPLSGSGECKISPFWPLWGGKYFIIVKSS